jgi:hypothetical protein
MRTAMQHHTAAAHTWMAVHIHGWQYKYMDGSAHATASGHALPRWATGCWYNNQYPHACVLYYWAAYACSAQRRIQHTVTQHCWAQPCRGPHSCTHTARGRAGDTMGVTQGRGLEPALPDHSGSTTRHVQQGTGPRPLQRTGLRHGTAACKGKDYHQVVGSQGRRWYVPHRTKTAAGAISVPPSLCPHLCAHISVPPALCPKVSPSALTAAPRRCAHQRPCRCRT